MFWSRIKIFGIRLKLENAQRKSVRLYRDREDWRARAKDERIQPEDRDICESAVADIDRQREELEEYIRELDQKLRPLRAT